VWAQFTRQPSTGDPSRIRTARVPRLNTTSLPRPATSLIEAALRWDRAGRSVLPAATPLLANSSRQRTASQPLRDT